MEPTILAVIAVVVVIGLSTVSDRLGIAPPLILMLVGVGISFLPFVAPIEIEPEWILAVILPPLLYGAAIAIPTVDFRRDFTAVGGLAVALVVISAVVMGYLIHLLLPGVSLPLGIALGAILSPTDAAATTIVRRLGVTPRVRIILQGESLLNDATALVLLRSAIAATAGVVSFWGVVADFLWAALAAAVIGVVIGWLGVQVRRLIRDSAPATAISFLIPFIAYIPAEVVDASGLVAVVAAGLVTAQQGPKLLNAQQRLAERASWHTVEFLLEGVVFLAMGLELKFFIVDINGNHETIWLAVGIAALTIVVTLVLRGGYIAALIRGTQHSSSRKIERSEVMKRGDVPGEERERNRREEALMERRAQMRARLRDSSSHDERNEHRLRYFSTLIQRYIADAEYLIRQPLGLKEGSLLTWAGMRGVVTLAAAQTLPHSVSHRSLMILIAFFVAAGSLVIQGGTLGLFAKKLGLVNQDTEPEGERERLREELNQVVLDWKPPEGKVIPEERIPLAHLRAQRKAVLELRSTGTYSSRCLARVLNELDAEEMGIQVRLSQGE